MRESNFKILQKFYESLPKLPRGRHRIVAGIWEKNKLISLGFNQYKTHPRQVLSQKNFNSTKQYLHAEIHALILAANSKNFSPRHSDIYVYRQTRDGSPALAAPCDGCALALALAGVKKIYYTTE
jgi:deoxycytidylate deaminase